MFITPMENLHHAWLIKGCLVEVKRQPPQEINISLIIQTIWKDLKFNATIWMCREMKLDHYYGKFHFQFLQVVKP